MIIKKEADKFIDSAVLEGMISIRAVLRGIDAGVNDRKIHQILYDPIKAAARARELGYLRAVQHQYGYQIEEADSNTIAAMTLGNSHGGLIATCSDRTLPSLQPKDIIQNGFYFMLDGIEDPYNFGYAVRSIYAAGANALLLPPRNWMTAAGVVARASAGASEMMPMYITNSNDIIHIFRQAGYRIVCADIKNSVSVYEADLRRPLLLIVGGEKRGITHELLRAADAIVRLDYGREFPAALSAASASSILAYGALRQNMNLHGNKG